MADIQNLLKNILSAVYGKDVRQSIHDAIHQCYEDGKAGQQDLIARERIESLSNPNLLINGDFRINQRGATTYNSASDSNGNATKLYTVDRWRISGKTGLTMTINNGLITLTNTSDNNIYLMQAFEEALPLNDYTLSTKVLEVSGDVKIYLENVNGKVDVVSGVNVNKVNGQPQGAVIGLYGQSSVTIEWIKLEQGKIATPFVPRLYAEELMLCQRY